jgi:hypothetical protein
VSPDFPSFVHAGYSQAEVIYGYADAVCRAPGTVMDRLLSAQYFVADLQPFPYYGVVVPLRRSAAPLCLRTDSAADAGAGCCTNCRFLDFDRSLGRPDQQRS